MVADRKKFFASQVKPGNANTPCAYTYIFPARMALSSESTTPFMLAGKLKALDIPLEYVGPYRFTLRRLNKGSLYVLEKAGLSLVCFEVNENGLIEGQDWLALDNTISELYIVYSPWKWDKEFEKKVSQNPAGYMQKVTLEIGTQYVGGPEQIGELVEEYREAPGRIVSLRGFPGAKAENVCDSEAIYADVETYAPKSEDDYRYLYRRWRDGGQDIVWRRPVHGALPPLPCPDAVEKKRAFLLAIHDSIGIAREFASLHEASVATLASRNDWFAYPHTIANYAKALLEVNPSYSEHLQQNYHIIESYWLGSWARSHGFKEPPEEMRKGVRPPTVDEKLYYVRDWKMADTPPYSHVLTWAVIREARRFPGAVKSKQTLMVYPDIDLGPKQEDEWVWTEGDAYRSKLPRGTSGYPVPGRINGQPRWILQPYEVLPAKWDVPGINGFLYERKKNAAILARQMKLLTDARTSWLGADGIHSFVSAMRRGSASSLDYLTKREMAYAECHAAFTTDDDGKDSAEKLYMKGQGEPVKLFKDVMAGKVEGQSAYVNEDESLTALIEIFGFYLENLPDATAKELHDAWDERLYQGATADVTTLSLQDLTRIITEEGLSAIDDTAHENKEAEAAFNAAKETANPAAPLLRSEVPPLEDRKAVGKPLEFYIRKEIIKGSGKWAMEKIKTEIKSRCLAIINDPSRQSGRARAVLKATRAFERYMKYWALGIAVKSAGSKPSLVSFLKLAKAVSSVLAVRRARAALMYITKRWGTAGGLSRGLIVILGKKSAGKYLGLFADLGESYSLYKKDDYDAAAMTAGTAVVTVALVSFGGIFSVISIPVGILGAILAGYWTNSVDEDWLTHCFWGRYYEKTYKKDSYPPFSYKQFFEKIEKNNEPEDNKRNPEAPEEGINEHGEQQLQWISMMSEPKLTHAPFAVYDTKEMRSKTLLYVKYTVRLFDALQSSIIPKASITTILGKKELTLNMEPDEFMPIPFRLTLGVPENGNDADIASDKQSEEKSSDSSPKITEPMQMVSLEGVFDTGALYKHATQGNTYASSGDYDFRPQLILEMTFKYIPEVAITKPKKPLWISLDPFDADMGDPAASIRYFELLTEIQQK
ncbi:MAG: hypothetical protein LBM00_00280 [Deltaproteobacteria bacterium]|nr:hypothetical protein [Deltaproteobacteria bacterium]